MGLFRANHNGQCECGAIIRQGEQIGYVDGVISCGTCYDLAETVPAPRNIFGRREKAKVRPKACPKCFLQHKGECW